MQLSRKAAFPLNQHMQVRALASTYLLLSASRYVVLASQVKTCPSDLLPAGSSATMATQAAKSSTADDALAQNQPAQTKGANAGRAVRRLCIQTPEQAA